MLRQTYGLLGRLLEEGNHIHMAVRLSFHYACAISVQTFSRLPDKCAWVIINISLLSLAGLL